MNKSARANKLFKLGVDTLLIGLGVMHFSYVIYYIINN